MRAINLVPADSRPGRVSGGKSGGAVFGVLGALVVLLVAVSLLAMSKSDEATANQELATVEQSTQAYTAVATQYATFERAASQAEQRIATVRGLAEARFDWAGTLRDLSRLVPADTQIFSLSASVGPASGGASGSGASSQFRAALEAPAVAMIGCSKSHTTVANLVNQLQAMRRVTNVTLEKSEQVKASDGTGSSSCTLGGTTSAFTVVVFFAPGKAKAAGTVVPGTTPAASTISSGSATPTTPAATTPDATTTNGAAQ